MQESRVRLGVVAICRNEERDLPAFLEHLTPWVDEIVIVDDGSTDRTEEIARAGGEKVNFFVSPRKPGEYYSDQANKGIDVATSDWLLHMDIDERVTEQLRAEILQLIRDPGMDAYGYHRLNFFLHRPIKHGLWGFYRSERLARRQFRFGGKIHLRLILDIPKTRIGKLKSYMWHYNEPTYELRLRKTVNYVLVDAETLLEKRKRVHVGHIVFRPLLEFFVSYIVFRGFLDGVQGLILALKATASVFDTYVLVWDAQNRIPRKDLEAQFERQRHSGAVAD
jgi:(heptosyl)LPS beta-1,4-glucosyltransferase